MVVVELVVVVVKVVVVIWWCWYLGWLHDTLTPTHLPRQADDASATQICPHTIYLPNV